MQIQMTPELQAELLTRLTTEYAETSQANFALDIIISHLQTDNHNLGELNTALTNQNRDLVFKLAALQEEHDALLAKRKKRKE
jgi:hypothetical protein